MALPTLHFKSIAKVAPAGGAINQTLDAIYTAGTAAAYRDTAARTQGQNSAWTWSRYQNAGTTEAVYATAPGISGLRVIFAGAAVKSQGNIVMSFDTFAQNQVLCGISKGVAGAFGAWDNANPFADGTFSGYHMAMAAAQAISGVWLFETEESIAIAFETATGTIFGQIMGAIIDPLASGAGIAESDERLYGMLTCGNAVINSTYLQISVGSNGFLLHAASSGNAHSWVWQPGTSTKWPVNRVFSAIGGDTTFFVNENGDIIIMPIPFCNNSASTLQKFRGMGRAFGLVRDGKHGMQISSGGLVKGFFFAGSTATDYDAIALLTNAS